MKRILLIALAGAFVGVSIFTGRGQETNSVRRPQPQPQRSAGANRFVDIPGLNALTEEQRASMVKAMQEQQQKVREIQIQIRQGRQELVATSLKGKFDEEAVRKQALAVANLEAELTVLRMKALAQVQPPLSPDQIDKLKSAGPAENFRPAESRPGRQRILQNAPRDENDLPPRQ